MNISVHLGVQPLLTVSQHFRGRMFGNGGFFNFFNLFAANNNRDHSSAEASRTTIFYASSSRRSKAAIIWVADTGELTA